MDIYRYVILLWYHFYALQYKCAAFPYIQLKAVVHKEIGSSQIGQNPIMLRFNLKIYFTPKWR